MYYRRKVILALLQTFDGHLEKVRLQKLLFLFCQGQQKREFDFVPYKYGCYSYSAIADINTMIKRGQLSENEKEGYKKTDKTDYIKSLRPADQHLMSQVKATYGKMNGESLMRHTYLNFPFFAINSIKASEILTSEEFKKVTASKPDKKSKVLYTIGYEGKSLEEYLNRLVENDVKVLVDVRNNPLSMKYGFSKSQLKKFCENLSIQYLHFPDVGIASEHRHALNNQSDYDKLFIRYCDETLKKTKETQIKILHLIETQERIALTCFEANICQCHRTHLAMAIKSLPGFNYELIHI